VRSVLSGERAADDAVGHRCEHEAHTAITLPATSTLHTAVVLNEAR